MNMDQRTVLFSEYPYMEDDMVIIRKMTEADAEKCGFEKKYTDIYEDWDLPSRS